MYVYLYVYMQRLLLMEEHFCSFQLENMAWDYLFKCLFSAERNNVTRFVQI